MNLYDRIVQWFDGPAPPPQEEKVIDFGAAIPGVSDGQLIYTYIDGLNQAYSTNYVIHKCINILANNMSKVPLRWEKNGELLQDDILINGFDIAQPHPRMSLSRLIYECSVYYWLKGEFMSYIDTENPFSLEPVDPDLMKISNTEGRIITNWRHKGGSFDIPEEQLIYVPMMNPDTLNQAKMTDRDRTICLLDVVEKELQNYASGRDFNTQFFGNYAQLGLTLKDVNGATSKEDRQQIANAIDNKLGRGKAWRTRVLPQGLDVADTKNLSMREMEFSQSLKDIRDIILGVFGVPRSVFGITNEAGLAQSTVDVEKRLMWTDQIQPACYQIQEAFNQTLCKHYFKGYKVKFDFSDIGVLQEDMLEKAKLATELQRLGRTGMEINEQLDMGWEETNDSRMNERFVEMSHTVCSPHLVVKASGTLTGHEKNIRTPTEVGLVECLSKDT